MLVAACPWALLPWRRNPLPAVPDGPQFMRSCVRYRASLDAQCPQAPRVADKFGGSSG